MLEVLTSLDEYVETLKRIINELQRTGARIIFATTTPVPKGAKGRSNAEINLYNSAAVELMNRNGIEVNDLNHLIKQDLAAHICEDKLYLSEQGNQRCAGQVIEYINKYL
ncbi:MAG: SGNH/GDSL hydrolase family protein [Bacillota bacterium]